MLRISLAYADVAPDEAMMAQRRCSLILNGPGFSSKEPRYGIETTFSGNVLAIQRPRGRETRMTK